MSGVVASCWSNAAEICRWLAEFLFCYGNVGLQRDNVELSSVIWLRSKMCRQMNCCRGWVN